MGLSTFIVVFFAGLYGYTFKPYSTDDITRHYTAFLTIIEFDTIQEFIAYQIYKSKPDFMLDVAYWFMGLFTSNYQFVGFLGSAMYYGLILGICRNWLSQYPETRYSSAFWSVVLCMLALIPTNEFCGMRQGNANALLLFFITWPRFYRLSTFKRYVCILIPCMVHFSVLPFFIIYFLARNLTYRKSVDVAIILASCGLVITQIMQFLFGILPSFGSIGAGIASKINAYMFSGELEASIFMGSRLRFYFILMLVAFSPLMFYYVKRLKWIDGQMNLFMKFSVITVGYVIFTSNTYILSRTLMLYKLVACLLLNLLAYNKLIKSKIRSVSKIVNFALIVGGLVFYIQAMEYRVVNKALFYKSLPELMQIETDVYGYDI